MLLAIRSRQNRLACLYNLMEKDETLRREYPGPRRLVRQLLEETQQDDLFTWAEKYDLINEFFVAINELALVMEGEIALSDAPQVMALKKIVKKDGEGYRIVV